MKCPHCQVEIHAGFLGKNIDYAGKSKDKNNYFWKIKYMTCPSCDEAILYLLREEEIRAGRSNNILYLIYPKNSNYPPAPPEVPKDIAEDYDEAYQVLQYSPKASAALSRRCMQHLFTERELSTKFHLEKMIDDVIESGLPSHLSDQLHAVREVGNFAAHPRKSEKSGEILPVEPHEAEWNLEVLEGLFDFYYVQPKKAEERMAGFNKKLKEAGRKPIGSTGSEEED